MKKPVEIKNIEIKPTGERGFRIQVPPGLINGTDYHDPALFIDKKYKVYFVEQEDGDQETADHISRTFKKIQENGSWESCTADTRLKPLKPRSPLQILSKAFPLKRWDISGYIDTESYIPNELRFDSIKGFESILSTIGSSVLN